MRTNNTTWMCKEKTATQPLRLLYAALQNDVTRPNITPTTPSQHCRKELSEGVRRATPGNVALPCTRPSGLHTQNEKDLCDPSWSSLPAEMQRWTLVGDTRDCPQHPFVALFTWTSLSSFLLKLDHLAMSKKDIT